MEGDLCLVVINYKTISISIHALRVEGDKAHGIAVAKSVISIHALRVEGDQPGTVGDRESTISIHALRVEGDYRSILSGSRVSVWLSTPSGWRATFSPKGVIYTASFSIHALRVEGDR